MGRFEVNTETLRAHFPGTPVWHDLYVDNPRDTEGAVLASFQLLPHEEAARTPIPDITPRMRVSAFCLLTGCVVVRGRSVQRQKLVFLFLTERANDKTRVFLKWNTSFFLLSSF